MATRGRFVFGVRIDGTDAAETFQGHGGGDLINAGGGDDTIHSHSGND